jgi:hypothetical protein
LKNKKYCILNKQYSKDEYEKLKEKIIEQMKERGEWGESFPIEYSPFPYNDTLAQDYFPLTREEAISKGYPWRDYTDQKVIKQAIKFDKDIEKVGEEILDEMLVCVECGKNYKIIPQEYRFYKILKISIPDNCPDCRYSRRMSQQKASKLYHRKCMNEGCLNEFETTYSPERPEKVYCEKCYQESII